MVAVRVVLESLERVSESFFTLACSDFPASGDRSERLYRKSVVHARTPLVATSGTASGAQEVIYIYTAQAL